jgi:hypothetical protein
MPQLRPPGQVKSEKIFYSAPVVDMLGSDMRKPLRVVGFLAVLSCLCGCPHRGTGEIDVDSVQGRVDQIDGQLKSFRQALETRDVAAARKFLERAREVLADHADELAAYPELGELKERLAQAAVRLCAAEIQAALSSLFGAVRERDVSTSRRRLDELKRCWQRCLEQHPREEEIFSLRAAVEAAPAEIEQLEKKLEEEKLAQAAEQAEARLRDRLQRLAGELEQAVKTPPSAERLQQLSDMLKQYRQELESVSAQLGQNPFWQKSLAKLAEDEKQLDEKFAYWQRRAELFRLATEDLPRAEKLNQQAVISRSPQEALSLVEQAHAIYSRCLESVNTWLKEDPQLAGWQVTWKGTKRDTKWLKAHCKSNADITGRLLKKVSGRPSAVQEEKPAAPAAKPAEGTTPKAKPRRGRIKRW